jgi:hypothetical protein
MDGGAGSGGSSGSVGTGGGILATFGERSGTTHSGVTMDTFISEGSASSFYKYGYMEVGFSPGANVILIRFEVSALAPTVKVQSAELSLVIWQSHAMTMGSIGIHQILEAWIDSQSDWTFRETGVPWTAVGCRDGSSSPTVLTTFTPSMAMEYKVALPASVVQGWVSNPSTNFGVALAATPGSNWADFRQSGVGTNTDPVLAVTYSP